MSFKTITGKAINAICVLGFGQMGQGIAQVAALAGYRVCIFDENERKLKEGHYSIFQQVEAYSKKAFPSPKDTDTTMLPTKREDFLSCVMSRIIVSKSVEYAASVSDLVIEAISEDRAAKLKLFSTLGHADYLSPDTILASNTSSFRIEELAVAANRTTSTIGLHFFNPVPKMRLVEMITLKETLPKAVSAVREFVHTLGNHLGLQCYHVFACDLESVFLTILDKELVQCRDTPGFVVNRLLVPYLFEAVRMAEKGSASIHDIDTAMKLGAGYPMGPFTLLDLVGIDTVKSIMDGWHLLEPTNPLYRPSHLINTMVAEGRLGRKTGQGFFKYEPEKSPSHPALQHSH